MIKKIKVYNRQFITRIIKDGYDSGFPFFNRTWHLVSIHGDSRKLMTPENVGILEGFGMSSCLSMDFWDITDDPDFIAELKISFPKYVLFNKEQANEVVEFLTKLKNDPSDDVLICHCDAGISRSGAVATFAAEFFGLDHNSLMLYNPNIHPNAMVLRMLREAAGLGGSSAYMTAEQAREMARKTLG